MALSIWEQNRYNVSILDMSSGLPHNWVNSVYEDSRGFIWVATYGGGLVRYDGYSPNHIPPRTCLCIVIPAAVWWKIVMAVFG